MSLWHKSAGVATNQSTVSGWIWTNESADLCPQADLPLVDGDYCWADGKSVSVYDSTVLLLTTDTGLEGVGEVVPLGPNYLASYAAGVRTGIQVGGSN